MSPQQSDEPQQPSLLIRPERVRPFSRGGGVTTLPYIGKWNTQMSLVTTGTTSFEPGSSIPLHTHNVDECVLVVAGTAIVTIGDEDFTVTAGVNTWVSAGTPHCFRNAGETTAQIFWIYCGLDVTRTICATGETFDHLSERDRT